jgi:hypothetical protein
LSVVSANGYKVNDNGYKVNDNGYKVSTKGYGIVAARIKRGRFNKFSFFEILSLNRIGIRMKKPILKRFGNRVERIRQ